MPERPDPPHGYFAHPDRFLTIEDAALYPRPIRVRFKEAGPTDAPPLLLVHGLQTSSYSWRYNIDALAKTYRVIVPDLIGCGLTDHPADFNYSPERVAQFIEAFRVALSKERQTETWDVVGNSLGGAYSAAYAAAYPDRVKKLVIIHAPGFMKKAPGAIELLRRGQIPAWATFLLGPNTVRDNLHYYRPDVISQEEVEQYSIPYGDAEGKRAFWHIVREGLSPEAAEKLEPTLAKIRTPTLLIWATQDKLIPAWTGHRWHQAIEGSELVWIPESSHFPHVEAPATVHRLLQRLLSGAHLSPQP